ncbi:MAG: ABC transporter permease [Candidatus Bathyarchaeota archaeon]|nr:ABC transporter permease [Candidatus Bathyarchaeota archaeon]
MLKGFQSIFIKELKELIRDPKILLGMLVIPLVLFPILGLVLGYAAQTAQEQAQKATYLVIDNDGGNWSQTFITFLGSSIRTIVVNNITPQQVLEQGLLTQNNSTQFIEIPAGFSANMTAHTNGNLAITATVNVYGVFQGGGIFSDIGSSAFSVLVSSFNRYIAPDLVRTTQSTIIKGEIQTGIDPATLSGLMMLQSIALPITIMIMLTYSMQIAATSVAMEKEEKTLETLLTVPVDRFAILMGKLSSTIIVAGLASVAMMVGYNYVIGSMTIGMPTELSVDLVKLGLVPSPFGYLLLGISLFITLLSGLALAVILSAFASDVRGATAMVGYIYPLIFLPAMALMYLDINTLPLAIKAVFLAIPYSQPMIASKAVIMNDYATVIFGIVYVAVFTVVVMYIASRLFATEKILTAKLIFKRKGFRKTAEPTE